MSSDPQPPPLPDYYNTQYSTPAAQPPAAGKPPGEAPPPYMSNQSQYQLPPQNQGAAPPMPPGYNGAGQPTGVINMGVAPVPVNGPRFRCPHCNTVFVSRIQARAFVICTGCRRGVSINRRATCLGLTFIAIGVLFLALSVGVTVLTLEGSSYIYYVWISGYVIGISMIVRGGIALLVKEAAPEAPLN